MYLLIILTRLTMQTIKCHFNDYIYFYIKQNMSRLLRVSSATTLKRSELLNKSLYEEANRLLKSLEVVPALQKFKECFNHFLLSKL